MSLKAVATPADAWEPTVRWSSSNPDIAAVDTKTGIVTGVHGNNNDQGDGTGG